MATKLRPSLEEAATVGSGPRGGLRPETAGMPLSAGGSPSITGGPPPTGAPGRDQLAVRLGPLEPRDGRAFARLSATRSDLPIMAEMLDRERAVARQWGVDHGADPVTTRLASDGRRQLLVVPDWAALVAARDVTAVGFFGQLRRGIDHAILFDLEAKLADTFASFAKLGLLSYHDLGAEHGRFGNLVLFSQPDGPELWHTNPAHREAVAIAPAHYESIRLHRGVVPGDFTGTAKLAVQRTSYLDFRGPRPWRAVRVYR